MIRVYVIGFEPREIWKLDEKERAALMKSCQVVTKGDRKLPLGAEFDCRLLALGDPTKRVSTSLKVVGHEYGGKIALCEDRSD